jgi:hypothetical protein
MCGAKLFIAGEFIVDFAACLVVAVNGGFRDRNTKFILMRQERRP